VGPLVVIASHEEAHTVGTLPVALGAHLHLVTQVRNHPYRKYILKKFGFQFLDETSVETEGSTVLVIFVELN
jgi:hypothetical protein